jgi:hypothetical protein
MSVTPYETTEISSVELDSATTKGLNQWQIESLHGAVLNINGSLATIGINILAAARQLYEVKRNIGKGNWTALLKSGAIKCTPKQAVDLCNAHEKWLINAEVDEGFIGLLSARSINAMANADEKARQRVYGLLKKSTTDTKVRISESEVRRTLKGNVASKKKAPPKSVDERIVDLNTRNAALVKKNKELTEKVKQYRALFATISRVDPDTLVEKQNQDSK